MKLAPIVLSKVTERALTGHFVLEWMLCKDPGQSLLALTQRHSPQQRCKEAQRLPGLFCIVVYRLS
jgi:hypothetical protein